MKLSSVSVSIATGSSGAGGLDTGTLSTSTWYYVWLIAKADGLRVIADSSAADVELVRSLGADVVVPRGDDIAAQIRKVAPEGVDGLADGSFQSVLAVGAVATNVIGRRLLARTESWLTRVPVFKTIYMPVKQLVAAFSPDNEYGFKRVVMVEDARRGLVMGFLTKEFTVDRGHGPEPLMAVYVPTNHLYLGDIVVAERGRVSFPDIPVDEGLRIFLTGGMALPGEIRVGSDSGHRPNF